MSDFSIGKLAQVIHVTGDVTGVDAMYRDVFGGQSYYEGYSPAEKRDGSLLAIGNCVVEPMAPADESGAMEMPVGRFFGRFGSHLHSIALNVKGVPELYQHLRDNNIRVVGPGGADPTQMADDAVKSIYTHPKDSHCLLEFVDFGPELMPGCPRLEPDWDPTPWRDCHPLGTDGLSHVTVVVRDLDEASGFFTDVLGCAVFHEESAGPTRTYSRFLGVGTETVVELAQPIGNDTRAALDLAANGEIIHAITLRCVDVDAAAVHLAANNIGLVARRDDAIVLDPDDCFGAIISLTSATLPNDPRH
jgi:catechol 2,3-dioxygenase-like lactoylglutathione lyase family enzyme